MFKGVFYHHGKRKIYRKTDEGSKILLDQAVEEREEVELDHIQDDEIVYAS
jgi:DNA-binding PadR family transcriptional regulator